MQNDSQLVDLEAELKALIVSALKLEGIRPDEIGTEDALFVDGLGLDSIDALELGVALRKKFGIQMEAATEDVKKHFYSVATLARFIRSQRPE